KIGARAKVRPTMPYDRADAMIDIGRDGEGEFFDIALAQTRMADARVLDTEPRIRHLLLMFGQEDGEHQFLCSHDERHWFVAALPEQVPALSVRTAFEALKPLAVRERQEQLQVKPGRLHRRRNEAFVRQGEWFFILAPAGFRPHVSNILYDEPIQRGLG